MLPCYDISHSDGGPERPCPGPGLGVGMDPLRPALSPESSLASPILENALSIYDSLAVCCACPLTHCGPTNCRASRTKAVASVPRAAVFFPRFAALLGVRFLEGWPWHGSPAVLDSVTLYPFTRACFDLATHESLAVPHNVAWQRRRLL